MRVWFGWHRKNTREIATFNLGSLSAAKKKLLETSSEGYKQRKSWKNKTEYQFAFVFTLWSVKTFKLSYWKSTIEFSWSDHKNYQICADQNASVEDHKSAKFIILKFLDICLTQKIDLKFNQRLLLSIGLAVDMIVNKKNWKF